MITNTSRKTTTNNETNSTKILMEPLKAFKFLPWFYYIFLL